MNKKAMMVGVAMATTWGSAVQAYVLNGNRWPGSHPRIPYYVSTNLQGNVPYDGSASFETVEEHIWNAANTWNTQGGSEAEFIYMGTTSVSQVADDGINTVFFSSGTCPAGSGCTAIAYYHQTNGIFRGFDVVLFKYRGGNNARIYWKTQMTHPSQMDLWTVVLHEFGHALGLDHSTWGGVVMGCAGAGITRRNLYADDINGLRAIYPSYSNEGFWSNLAEVQPGGSFELRLDYPRAAGQNFALFFNAEADGLTAMSSPDSRILPLASPFENTLDYPDIFLNPTCLQGGQCQGMFGTLDANGRATVTAQIPPDSLTSLGSDLYLSAVTRNTSMPSGYEDISVGVHVQIVAAVPCIANAECDDGDACTDDFCEAGECVNLDFDCDDGNVCTVDSCNDGTCESQPLMCNDNNACTADSCEAGIGCVGVPISCDDGDACTIDSCNPATGCAYSGVVCNDGNTCTTDSCEPTLGCVYTPISGCNPCKQRDAACTNNAECCSGKCRSNHTCG